MTTGTRIWHILKIFMLLSCCQRNSFYLLSIVKRDSQNVHRKQSIYIGSYRCNHRTMVIKVGLDTLILSIITNGNMTFLLSWVVGCCAYKIARIQKNAAHLNIHMHCITAKCKWSRHFLCVHSSSPAVHIELYGWHWLDTEIFSTNACVCTM